MTDPPALFQRKIVLYNRDLFSGIGVMNAIRSLGFEPVRESTLEDFGKKIAVQDQQPALGIIDMNAEVDWELVSKLVGIPNCPPIIGFGPHVDVENRRAAKKAGLTRIVSNGEFTRDTVNLIERYARTEANSLE